MIDWRYIIIHHSATEDGKIRSDFDTIKRFHTSYRYRDEIITKQQAEELIKQGKRVVLPWRDIGYHFVIEYENNVLKVKQGRELTDSGAHCIGMNNKGIGICLVGNFDIAEPVEEQYAALADLVFDLMRKYNIPLRNVRPHSFYATYKSCCGSKFVWSKLYCNIVKKNIDIC